MCQVPRQTRSSIGLSPTLRFAALLCAAMVRPNNQTLFWLAL
jgi:hypothetical protein